MYCGQIMNYHDQQFPDWFEEKANLPIFEVLPTLDCNGNGGVIDQQQQFYPQYLQPNVVASPIFVPVVEADTSQLLQEFENVLSETLTPPESPKEEDILTLLQGMGESTDLDALVASRVDDSLYTKAVCSGATSPGCTSTTGSACGGDESDFSAPASDSGCEDPDWLPSGTDSPRNDDPDWSVQDSEHAGGPVSKKRKTTAGGRLPYSRSGVGPDERKLRKKEQNKNAATRYRQKKKAEVEGILDEEKGLKTTNDDLKVKLTDLQREIKYLKSLMRDVFRAKGLIK